MYQAKNFLSFDTKLVVGYKSETQKIRIMTESWVKERAFCPNCGNEITKYDNNRPVADFYCKNCLNDFELKSKRDSIGTKIVDGAYRTMIERIHSDKNPSFFFMNYRDYAVENLLVIPKHFFIDNIIEKRNPLADSARRAGWIGCNILLNKIPESGRVYYVKHSKIIPRESVISEYNKTKFLQQPLESRGWLLDVMNCVDDIKKRIFSLDEIYNYEKVLKLKHPDNKHIKDKIRQQLQFLRDKGYLEFKGDGKYELI